MYLQKPPAEMMTVKELADYLRVHPSTVYRMLRRENLPAMKMGSDWRFILSSIQRWLLERETEGRSIYGFVRR